MLGVWEGMVERNDKVYWGREREREKEREKDKTAVVTVFDGMYVGRGGDGGERKGSYSQTDIINTQYISTFFMYTYEQE